MNAHARRKLVYEWLRDNKDLWDDYVGVGHPSRYCRMREIPDWLLAVVCKAKIDGIYAISTANVDVATYLAEKIANL